MKFRFAWAGLVAACAGAGPAPAPLPAVPSAALAPLPADATVETTLFLIGDAGAPAPGGEPVLRALAQALGSAAGDDRVVVFLGDNVYPRGLPDSAAPDRPEMERRLDAQMDVVLLAGARGIFVPGNHDWARHAPDGWNAIRREERWIAKRGAPGITMLPGSGCPGPSVVDVGSRVRLVLLDTQWWLHAGPKPGPHSGCRAAEEGAVTDSLRADLAGARGRSVIVAAHHPLESAGEHAGFFGIEEHLFPLRAVRRWLWLPLPGLGSIYPLARQRGISNQDQTGPVYQRMRQMFEAAMRDHPPLVWASGHEHNLEVLEGTTARWLLVSGAGIYGHEGPAFGRTRMRFGAADAGFMRIEFLADGRARLGVLAVDREGRSTERFALWLE
jgi:hypothetical protein